MHDERIATPAASIPACARHPIRFPGARIAAMKISARNQLRGTVEEIVRGVITAKVSVRVGENLIESVITLQSVDEMGIKKGDTVTALIKSTEVLLMTD